MFVDRNTAKRGLQNIRDILKGWSKVLESLLSGQLIPGNSLFMTWLDRINFDNFRKLFLYLNFKDSEMNKSLVLAAVVASMALVACGEKKVETPVAVPAPAPAPTVIVVPAPAPAADAAAAAASGAAAMANGAASAASGAMAAAKDASGAAKDAAGAAKDAAGAAKDAAGAAGDAAKKAVDASKAAMPAKP